MDSALHQNTTQKYEIVVVDNDAETDSATDALMKEYCAKHKNLLYYRNGKNLGMCGNWNRCIELSRSNIFTILHDDDMLLPEYIRIVYPIAKATPFGTIAVFSTFFNHSNAASLSDFRIKTDGAKKLISKIRGMRLFPFELEDVSCNIVPGATACLFNKEACLDIGGFELRDIANGKALDNLFHPIMRTKYPVYFLPQILAQRGIENNDSMNGPYIESGIVASHILNGMIIESLPNRRKGIYHKINDIMTLSLYHSFKQTYGTKLNVNKICDELKINMRTRKVSMRKITILKALLWGKAILRPEPGAAKRARKQLALEKSG